MKRFIAVTPEEFKRQLVKADANGQREELLMDALAANVAVMANTKTLNENLALLENSDSKAAGIATKIEEALNDETLSAKKFEKRILNILFE